MQTKLEKLPKSRVRLTITVPAETIETHYHKAIDRLKKDVEIKGFRKGHAPASMIISRLGNPAILQEMLESAVPDAYYLAMKDQKDMTPVAQPAIDVKELKGLSPEVMIPTEMIFTAEVDVMPEFSLPDYKKLRVKEVKAADKVDTKEIDGTITEMKKLYGDDYLAKGQFKDEAEMRKAIEDSLAQEKKFQAQSDTYDAIIDELIKKTKVEVPMAFTHNEIHRMEQQVTRQAAAYGMTFDDWLKSEKKTHEQLHEEWHEMGEKAAKAGMILGKIAEAEGIDPTNNQSTKLVLEKLHTYMVK